MTEHPHDALEYPRHESILDRIIRREYTMRRFEALFILAIGLVIAILFALAV